MFAQGWLVEVISVAIGVVGFWALALGVVGFLEFLSQRGVAFAVVARGIAFFVALVVVGIGFVALGVVGIELIVLSGVGKMFAPGWLVNVLSVAIGVVGLLAWVIGFAGFMEILYAGGVAFAVAACRIALFVALLVVGEGLMALGVVLPPV